MAISLTTGLPGHGKTLRTIVELEERRVNEGRRIYYHGIPDLTLDWFPLEDATKWYEVPDGSIVVIDEAQKTFPVRPNGSAVPQHVSEFETHRHKGIDVVLITQHPNLLDSHVRRLVERHQHVMRPFGYSYAVVFEWQVCTDPQRSGAHKSALKHRWKYPKSAFKYYKSASVHTVKKRLPGKILLLPLMGTALGLLLFFAKYELTNHDDSPQQQQQEIVQSDVAQVKRVTAPAAYNPIPSQQVQQVTTQPEPFSGWSFYVAGDFNNEVLIGAETRNKSIVLRESELIKSGYYVKKLSPCIVRIGYRHSLYYATCRNVNETRQQNGEPPQVQALISY